VFSVRPTVDWKVNGGKHPSTTATGRKSRIQPVVEHRKFYTMLARIDHNQGQPTART